MELNNIIERYKLMKVLAHTKIAGIKSHDIDLESLMQSQDKMRDMEQLIGNMVKTCVMEQGLGLAAPQVGINKRLFIELTETSQHITSEFDSSTRLPQTTNASFTAYLNPSWTYLKFEDGKETEKEGCLSVKTEQPLAISRYSSILASWYEIDFTTKEIKEMRAIRLTGMRAKLFQHECEHLNGGNIVETYKRQQQQQKRKR